MRGALVRSRLSFAPSRGCAALLPSAVTPPLLRQRRGGATLMRGGVAPAVCGLQVRHKSAEGLSTDAIDDLLDQLAGAEQAPATGGPSTPAQSSKAKAQSRKRKGAGKRRTGRASPPTEAAEDRPQQPAPQQRPLSVTQPAATLHAAHEQLLASSPAASSPAAGGGWDYEDVDAATGLTKLEALYSRSLDTVHRILEQPLPPLPPDGHVSPDLFIGFAHYDYRLRDEYRAVIARELRVPVRAVKLSVAWGGRFDVSRFNRVRKVCGVCLDRGAIGNSDSDGSGEGEEDSVSAAGPQATRPLPDAVAERVAALVEEINGRRAERLLQCQLTQASGAIPEVEFGYTRGEYRLLLHLHDWLRAHVLKRSLAVVVVGGNQRFHAWRTEEVGPSSSSSSSSPPLLLSAEEVAARFARSAGETTQQMAYVERRWLKTFFNRKVVPRRLTVGEVAAVAAGAVLSGKIPAVTAAPGETLLPAAVQPAIHAAAPELTPFSGEESGADAEATAEDVPTPHHQQQQQQPSSTAGVCVFDSPSFWAAQPHAVQAGALQWLQLVRDALLLGEQQQQKVEDVYGRGGVAEDDGVYRRAAQFTGDLPALFVHGAYAGGVREMRYLQSNKAAMDALLLHPNDITMKRAFASRMWSGHQRLRMHEEVAAGDHTK